MSQDQLYDLEDGKSSRIDEPDVTLMHYHASPDILNAFGAVSTRRGCLILTRSLESDSMVVELMLCNTTPA